MVTESAQLSDGAVVSRSAAEAPQSDAATARERLVAECNAFAEANLAACAAELLEWRHETGLLRDGAVRQLAALCALWAGATGALRIAERMVEDAALRVVAFSLQPEKSA